MSKNYNEMATLKRKVKSLTAKSDAAERESTDRGIALASIDVLTKLDPMPDGTRALLREALESYLDRCGQGGRKRKD